MTRTAKLQLTLSALIALSLGAAVAQAQPAPHERAPAKAAQPANDPKQGEAPAAGARLGDPYPFDTCPVSGKKLGGMGDPITKMYEGREVRFCCPMCPPRFEKDLSGNVAKLDQRIIKDQAALYPLKTSLVTGKALPEKPYEFVYGNRLVRLGAESEKAAFLKDAKTHLATLDQAVIEAQSKDYPLKTCPVSKEELGGAMGKPVDDVVAGRLIRLSRADCREDVEKNPAKFIAMIDAARKGGK